MRVPVIRAHTESIHVTFNGVVTKKEILDTLRSSPNVMVLDESDNFPTACKASGGNTVLVGHVRVVAQGDNTSVSHVACGDQIRTGTALNAVSIAKYILSPILVS